LLFFSEKIKDKDSTTSNNNKRVLPLQTFLPYADFRKSVRALDSRRLGKQRVEAMQILNALMRGEGAWYNHPATKMWAGHEAALALYMNECITEWISRGYRNTMTSSRFASDHKLPSWFGDESFHASHRSNLLRKDPVHYGQFDWTEPHDVPYVWPLPQSLGRAA
jgi:hypothetical protein